MKAIVPVCEWPVAATLGEGPVWHAAERAVYFVDIKGRRLHRLSVDTGERAGWDAPAQPGFVLPLDEDGFVCGLQGGLYRFSPADGKFARLMVVEAALAYNRLNDGYVDARGRLWFGSMDDAEQVPSGSLYCVDTDGTLTREDSDYVITNGPATSPDGRTLYHVDTLERLVYAFDLAPDGRLSGKRVFTTISGSGYPDGLAVDADGYVWIALFGGGRIERFSADGSLVGQVVFPCSNVTKLAFGGDDLQTVYATTARKGLDAAVLAREPLAGGLFSFRAPVPGQPQARCRVQFHR
jgi:sugar lactone lactonase YvrE